MDTPVNVFHRDKGKKATYRVRSGRSFVPRDGEAYRGGTLVLLPEGYDESRGLGHVLERVEDQSSAVDAEKAREQGRDDATGKRTRAVDTTRDEIVSSEHKSGSAQVNANRKGGV